MNIDKDLFLRFLKLVALQGEIENKEVMLNISKTRIDALSVSEGKHVALCGTLEGDYEDIGTIGIDNISYLSSLLSNFSGGEVVVTKKENKLYFSSDRDKTKVSYILKNPEYILNKITFEKFDEVVQKAENNNFRLTKVQVKRIAQLISSMCTDNLILSGEGKNIKISVEDSKENNVVVEFDLEDTIKKFQTKLSKVFLNILKVIGEVDLVISTKDNSPILICFKSNKLDFLYLLAPLKK